VQLIDNGQPVAIEDAGSYGLALIALCKLLGASENENLVQCLSDNYADIVPEQTGWFNASDGEGGDLIYHNGKQVAQVMWSARGSWWAEALLHDGRVLFSQGENSGTSFDAWATTLTKE